MEYSLPATVTATSDYYYDDDDDDRQEKSGLLQESGDDRRTGKVMGMSQHPHVLLRLTCLPCLFSILLVE